MLVGSNNGIKNSKILSDPIEIIILLKYNLDIGYITLLH